MLFMNRLEFSCFVDFFVCSFITRVEYGMVFFKNPPVEGTVNSMRQKTWVFCQIDVQEFHLSCPSFSTRQDYENIPGTLLAYQNSVNIRKILLFYNVRINTQDRSTFKYLGTQNNLRNARYSVFNTQEHIQIRRLKKNGTFILASSQQSILRT